VKRQEGRGNGNTGRGVKERKSKEEIEEEGGLP
jgi:hypothetical protein